MVCACVRDSSGRPLSADYLIRDHRGKAMKKGLYYTRCISLWLPGSSPKCLNHIGSELYHFTIGQTLEGGAGHAGAGTV